MALREGAGLCHSVVALYCSSCLRVLGICVSCVERTTSRSAASTRCWRASSTSRARPGSARAGADRRVRTAAGFTVAQLQSLDFAAMDFTEFYASLVPTQSERGHPADQQRVPRPGLLLRPREASVKSIFALVAIVSPWSQARRAVQPACPSMTFASCLSPSSIRPQAGAGRTTGQMASPSPTASRQLGRSSST